MTETSPVSAMTTTDDPLAKRVDSVGRLLPHVEYVFNAISHWQRTIEWLILMFRAKIVSSTDRSKILPVGERGELVVSGYLLQKGYWNDPIRTAEVMEVDTEGKRWMHVRFPPFLICSKFRVVNKSRLVMRRRWMPKGTSKYILQFFSLGYDN